MEARHPQAMDAGLFLLAVAVPLAFFPLSSAPFADAKLVLLTLGTLLLWVSGVPGDRRLALPAGVWIAVVVVAALAGVDPRMSIVGSVNRGTGLIMLATCASLVVLGPNIPPEAVSRMRRWLVGTGLVVAAVAVGFRVAPDAFDRVVRDLSFRGSTAGNPVFAAAFLAACIPAAVGSKATGRRLVAVLAVLALGFAANGERSSLLLPFLALATCLWPMRADRARVFLAGATLLVVVSGWILLVAPFLPSASHEVSATARQFDTLTGERQRLAVSTADLRGFTRRPVLGWGPTNTWSAFLSSATSEEIDTAGRGWAEAHNILLESLVTTGLAGTAAFLWLPLRIAPRMARPHPGAGWAAGGALTLAVFHLYEPLSLTVTPLMFLLAGVTARAPAATPERAVTPAPAPGGATKGGRAFAFGRVGVGAALAAMLLVSCLALGASALEQWGRTHYGEWSLRASLRLQPWRLSATELLARNLAVDGYLGDEAAAADARSVMDAAVRQHPWNPHVRLSALDVELLLRNLPGAQDWVRRHLERFPSDPVTIPTSLPT